MKKLLELFTTLILGGHLPAMTIISIQFFLTHMKTSQFTFFLKESVHSRGLNFKTPPSGLHNLIVHMQTTSFRGATSVTKWIQYSKPAVSECGFVTPWGSLRPFYEGCDVKIIFIIILKYFFFFALILPWRYSRAFLFYKQLYWNIIYIIQNLPI